LLTVYDNSWRWIPTALKYATYLLDMINIKGGTSYRCSSGGYTTIKYLSLHCTILLYYITALRRCTYIMIVSVRNIVSNFNRHGKRQSNKKTPHPRVGRFERRYNHIIIYYNTALLKRIDYFEVITVFIALIRYVIRIRWIILFSYCNVDDTKSIFPDKNVHCIAADVRTTLDFLSWRYIVIVFRVDCRLKQSFA